MRTKAGKFELCDKGTILLDEVAEMPANLQAKLLHVLQDRQFFRLGGETTIAVDVRILAATNVNIQQAIAERRFREDLYYRLSAFTICLPPLRNRRGEIPVLLRHFMQRIASEYARPPRSLSQRLLDACQHYSWPGNVRELENVIRRALVVAKGPTLLPGDLPPEIIGTSSKSIIEKSEVSTPSVVRAGGVEETSLAALAREMFRQARLDPKLKLIPVVERALVIEALRETHGNQVHAAKLLGITRATLRKRIEKFEIRRELNIE